MAPPKDIARSYPKRGLTADVGFRSEPKFCGDGAAEFATGESAAGTYTNTLNSTLSMCCWVKAYILDRMYFMDIGSNSSRTQISISYHDSTGAGKNKRPYIWNGSTALYATQEMEINEWHHLAVTSAPGAGNIKIYLDGIDVTPSHAEYVTITTNDIYLSKWVGPTPFNANGKMANAALFRTTLTQEQVRECMRASSFSQFDAISTLEAFYPLDANFNDSTSGGHDLTATGSPSFTVDRPQLPRGLDLARGAAMARVYTGRAVDFDGSADRLRAAHYNPGGDYLTTTAWVNADAIRFQGLIYNGYTGRNSFLFYMLSTGVLRFYWNDTTGDAAISHQTTLSTGRWYHLAAVMDMSDPADHQVTFYIDGIAATGTRIAAGFSGDNNYGFGNEYSTFGWFDGKIADCRIYDVALTQAQIRELYHNPEQVLPTGVSASNLRRYYPLSDYNDTAGTGGRYFQDMGADGEPAEDQGSALMAFAQPVPCPQLGLQQSATRLLFPGGATTHNAVATTAALGTTASVSCWFQCKDSSPTQILFSIGNTAGTGFFEAWIGGGNLKIFGQSNITVSGVTEGAWTHLVVTTDSGSPPYKAYVNGAEISLTGSDTARNFTNGTFEIGNQDVAYGPIVFNGILNDVACWNTELSLSDAQSLYNSGVQGMDVSTVQSSNLKGWWKCDDLTTLKDYSGNGANATVTNTFAAASFPENASGSTIVGDFSMKRKGVSVLNAPGSGRATLAANASLLPTTGGGYTLCAFVRLQSTDNDAAVIMSTSTGTNEWGMFYEGSTNKYKIVLSDGTTNILDRAFTGNVTDSEWHHIAWTIQLDAVTATGETYIDGAPDLSFTRSSFNTPPTPSEFAIGYDPGNADKQANAAIACLRIYQSVLSANEIKQVYSSDLRLIKGLNNE